jgi:glutamine synthetase
MVERATAARVTVRIGYDLAWALDRETEGGSAPRALAPAHRLTGLACLSDYAGDLAEALAAAGVEIDQLQGGAGEGQVELSLAARDPLAAADLVVFARETILTISARHGWRCTFGSPAASYGGRLRLSVSRAHQDPLADRDVPDAMSRAGEAFTAGVLLELPALTALGASSVASCIRAPSGSDRDNAESGCKHGGSAPVANIEVITFDQTANPYLALGALLAAGLAGIEGDRRLPAHAETHPGTIERALHALAHSTVLNAAMGPALLDTVVGSRRSELERPGCEISDVPINTAG